MRKAKLDQANGETVAASFKSPEEAGRWQEIEGRLDHTNSVHESDGKTVIGDFTVYGTDTIEKQTAAAGFRQLEPSLPTATPAD